MHSVLERTMLTYALKIYKRIFEFVAHLKYVLKSRYNKHTLFLLLEGIKLSMHSIQGRHDSSDPLI